MQKDSENYTPKCRSCQKNKHAVPNNKIEMEIQTNHRSLVTKYLCILTVRFL